MTNLQKIRREWYQKLKEEGFKDIEDSRGNLKQHDLRTRTFTDQEKVKQFFTKLEQYLWTYPDIPDLHREILTYYCKGSHIKKIAELVHRTRMTVHTIIVKYRDIIR